jgi:calcium-dependent protein kinase
MGCGRSKDTALTPHKKSAPLAIPSTLIRKHTKLFLEEYQLGNKIGTGGFAEVRRCTHKHTGSMRAVKIYNKSLFPPDYITSNGFVQEIETLRMIDHPNIIKVYEYFEDDKNFYITMEFYMGGELFDKIGMADKLPEYRVCDIMRQLFSVTAYMHSKNIVHRDLKPENILIEDRSDEISLKIADFGNAVIMNGSTMLKGQSGTCYYMAPEVIDQEYTEKCDVWSCAVIMFMLFTGNPPFKGTNDEEIIQNVKKGFYSLDGPEFLKISGEAKDLIKKVFVPEDIRPSAIEVLKHSWFTSHPIKKNIKHATITSITHNLKNFKEPLKLKRAIKAFIISQIFTLNDVKSTKEVFSLIDHDQDGIISEKDLTEYLHRYIDEKKAGQEALVIIKDIDTQNRGYIEYSQYLRASIDNSVVLSRKNLLAAFNMLDTDGQGTINSEKLMHGLSHTHDRIEPWEEVIYEVSKINNGTISLQKFIEVLMQTI